jgi:hypothetical protein
MRSTPNTPKKSLRGLQFCTPIGTEGVRLEGTHVLGRWQQKLSNFDGLKNRLLVEDFVNWSNTPEEIVRFVRMWGPLGDDAREGKDFRFSVQGWRGTQQRFRQMWEARSGKANLSTTLGGELPYQLNFSSEGLRIWSQTLEGYLRLELFTAPAERFRKCKRPGCETPYFIARHLRQTYCSEGCAKWAQSQWKEKWWDERGSDWLAGRKKRKGSSRSKVKHARSEKEKR